MNFLRRLFRWMSLNDRSPSTSQLEKINHLLRDARHAQYAENYNEALDFLDQAATIATEAHQQTAKVNIDLTRGDILIAQQRYADAKTWLDNLKHETEGRQHRAPLAYTLASLGLLAQRQHQWDKARQYYEQARDIADEVGALGAEGRATAHLADVYLQEENTSYAEHLLTKGVQKLRSSGDNELLGYFTAQLGMALYRNGKTSDGIEQIRQGLQIAQAIEHQAQIRQLNTMLGDTAFEQLDYTRAQKYYRDAIETFSSTQKQSVDYAKILVRLSHATRQLGDAVTARNLAVDALTILNVDTHPQLYAQATSVHALAAYIVENTLTDDLIAQLQQAADAYADLPTDIYYIEVLRRLAAVYSNQNDLSRAEDLYKTAIQAADTVASSHLKAQVYHNLGSFYAMQDNNNAALSHWETAQQHYEDAGIDHQIARLYCDTGAMYLRMGNTRRALKAYEDAAMRLSSVTDTRTRGIVLAHLAAVYTDYGDLDSAEDFFQQAIQLAKQIGDQAAESRRRGNYGRLLALTDRGEHAIDMIAQAQEQSNALGLHRQTALQTNNLGLAYAAHGDVQQAIEHLENALDQLKGTRWEADVCVNLADAYCQRQQVDAAASHYATASSLADTYHDVQSQVRALIGQAQVALIQHHIDQAATALDDAYPLAKRHQLRREQARIFTIQSQVSAAQDDLKKARIAWDEAKRLRTIMKMPLLDADWL